MSVEIRPMRSEDLNRVSELSAQLGYPVSMDVLEVRFSRIADNPGQALFVAESNGRVVGWVHVHPQLLLESEPYAEIGALVVGEDARRIGAGRALVLAGSASVLPGAGLYLAQDAAQLRATSP
jgi:N-acetylglutamate synthase-like GNAT family acetyltransferase